MEDKSSTLFKFYKGDVISTLRSLWMDDIYKDVTITTSEIGFLVQCHSAVLSLASPFLNRLLQEAKANNESGPIHLHIADLESVDIKVFVMTLYCLTYLESEETQINSDLISCLRLGDSSSNL